VIRVHAFMVRRPDLTRDEFRAHYEEIHVPTALPILGGTAAYVRHHVREELHGAPPFDCMTLFEYPDAKTTAAVFARAEGPEGAAVRADEQTFMDKPRNFFFAVAESAGADAHAGSVSAAPALFLLCARRPPGEDAGPFRARLLADALPRLRAALERPGLLRLHTSRDAGARYDATLLCSAAGAGRLAEAARELERDGSQWLALRVTAHATPMGG
jgi:hypothetical protein